MLNSRVLGGILCSIDYDHVDLCQGASHCNFVDRLTDRYLGGVHLTRVCERRMLFNRVYNPDAADSISGPL